jgi:hypothetical protein
MNLCVPDILTTGNAEKYAVSIRLWPGGLSFAGHIPSEKNSFFYSETEIDRTKPYIQAIKDLFFAYPFFLYPYKQIYVICANRQYTLIPDAIFLEQQKEQLMSFVFSSPEDKTLYESLDEFDSKILFGIQPEVYDFFSHSLINPIFTHAITAQLMLWRYQSLTAYPRQLYVALHEDTMDVACFYRDTLLFINSFQVDDTADMLYYILYVWKQTGMDQQKDKVILTANNRTSQALKETLQTYLLQVEFIQPLWPGTGLEVPPDIITLFRCES